MIDLPTPYRGRGRPALRPLLCTCSTPEEAVRVVQAMRVCNIKATWRPHKSEGAYRLRVDRAEIREARRLLKQWLELPR